MKKIEIFFLTSYQKIVLYLNQLWNNTVKSIYSFDFTMLVKVGFIILLGYFLAKILSKYIPKSIQLIGKKINLTIDSELILAMRSFIFKLILFLFVLIAINMFSLSESIEFIASAIVKSILILSFVGFIFKIVKLVLYKMANSPRDESDTESVNVVQESTLPLFENTALILFYLAGIYQVFAIWNVDMTALLAGAGIGAMAVGMAAKDTLSDVIAGILILTDSPYRVGDVVYVKNNLKGRVSAIGLRNTRLITKSNIEVIVPNTIMGTSQIINESSSKAEGIRIQMDVAVSHGEDISTVKSLLIEAVKVSKRIAQDKEIKAMMIGFEREMLRFRIQCWINDPEDKGSAKGELMESVYLKFYDAKIDISMTQTQHITVAHEGVQELHVTQFPDTKQEQFVKEFPDTKQEQFVKEFPDTRQAHFVKEFPDTKQEQFVKEFPDTKQEQFVKEFPDTKQEQFVKEFPDTKQEQFVKEFPNTKQEQFVKEFPNTKQDINIKEIPNLFGNGMPKKLTKVTENPLNRDTIKNDKYEK